MQRSRSAPQGERLGLERPRFGQFARQIAGIRIAEIEECLAEQKQKGGQLGEILCRRGLLAHEQVVEVLKMQARWVAGAMSAELPSGLPYPAKLSVCFPAYNEEANITSTLEGACAILPEFVRDFELVVVNDGSADHTADRVGEFAWRDPRVRLVTHEQNRGYGAAVTTGLRAATGDLVMFTDADGQFSLLDLPRLLVPLADNDFVIGYRLHRADKFSRLVNAWCWNRLVRLMLGVRVRDLDGAFKIFRRELVERLQLTATGACINAEIMAQCVRGGLRFAEVPVNHYPRYGGTPTGANLKVIAKAFRELPQLWQYRHAAPLAASPSNASPAVGR